MFFGILDVAFLLHWIFYTSLQPSLKSKRPPAGTGGLVQGAKLNLAFLETEALLYTVRTWKPENAFGMVNYLTPYSYVRSEDKTITTPAVAGFFVCGFHKSLIV